jgi:hypothetical protein
MGRSGFNVKPWSSWVESLEILAMLSPDAALSFLAAGTGERKSTMDRYTGAGGTSRAGGGFDVVLDSVGNVGGEEGEEGEPVLKREAGGRGAVSAMTTGARNVLVGR